jgi:hypothetical protein
VLTPPWLFDFVSSDMKKVLAPLLVFIFLAVQSLALVHNANYGEDHDHDGHACDIALFVAACHFTDATPPVVPEPTVQVTPEPIALVATAIVAAPNYRPLPRGPPTLRSSI